MTDSAIAQIYSQPQVGGDLPYFIGKQYGSGWLRSLGRIAFPIIKKLAGVAANTAEDVIMNDEKILPSLAKNSISAVKSMVVRKRPRKSINKRKRLGRTIFSK